MLSVVTTQGALLRVVITQCTEGISFDRMKMAYTHEQYCDMFLTLDTCNSQPSNAAREHALLYPIRRHPDGNVFQRLERRFRDTRKCKTYGTRNADRTRTFRRQTKNILRLRLCSASTTFTLGRGIIFITSNTLVSALALESLGTLS
jgi:hypothetical protein